MAEVEGKSPAERNKMIVAVVLGAIAVVSLAYMLFGSSSTKTTQTTANRNRNSTASATPAPGSRNVPFGVQPPEEFIPTEVRYDIQPPPVPEAGRNIFAFYVPPPKPTPDPNATPVPVPTPTPVPPNLVLSSLSPVNVYAHTGDFTLDVSGDKFTPDTRIYVGGAELPTRFVSPQQLSARVPAQIISFEGAREIKVQSRDGKLFSNTATLNVMPAPVPNFTMIGIMNRTGSNDSAILKDKNGRDIINVQRGDLVGGRFRVTSISLREVVLTDTALKIKHTLPLTGDNSNPGGQPRYTPPPNPPADDNEP